MTREYYLRNREHILARQKASYQRNRDRKLAYQKAYYQKHRAQGMATSVRHYRNNKDRILKVMRLRIYGIGPDQFDALLQNQQGLCAICSEQFRDANPHLDHDHATGRIRGLLCAQCNLGLGKFKDDPALLMTAALYVMPDDIAAATYVQP